jgi:hypothetical protein
MDQLPLLRGRELLHGIQDFSRGAHSNKKLLPQPVVAKTN